MQICIMAVYLINTYVLSLYIIAQTPTVVLLLCSFLFLKQQKKSMSVIPYAICLFNFFQILSNILLWLKDYYHYRLELLFVPLMLYFIPVIYYQNVLANLAIISIRMDFLEVDMPQ